MYWRIPIFLIMLAYGIWCAMSVGDGLNFTGTGESQVIEGFPWQPIVAGIILLCVYNLYIVLNTKVLVDGFRLSNEFRRTGVRGTINLQSGTSSFHDVHESDRSHVFKYIAGTQWFGYPVLAIVTHFLDIELPMQAPLLNQYFGLLNSL